MSLPFVQVVAGLMIEDGKILIARRLLSDSNGGLWEFPGGKVEKGESPEQALSRELKEELNLYVKVGGHFGDNHFETVRAKFELKLYVCRRLSGTIFLTEHSEFAWITLDQIDNYKFLSGDYIFLDRLKAIGSAGISILK